MSLTDTPAASTEQREANGRFAKGNAGGPGNPYARKVAALRNAIHEAVTEDDFRAIALKLAELARAGDVAAARLLFQYAIGRPIAVAEPDRLDQDEVRALRENALTEAAAEAILATPAAPILDVARLSVAANGEKARQQFFDMLRDRIEADGTSSTFETAQGRSATKAKMPPPLPIVETETLNLIDSTVTKRDIPTARAANEPRS